MIRKEKSCVYFLIKNGTEINTEVIHLNDASESDVILKAKMKLTVELGINIDFIADKVGRNKVHDGDWTFVDFVEYID
ncbi:hypothetical protein CIL05_07245 [Virgibacillus profundi]|uniref:Uncharacterized protein n=1 Tax=Virgibacillus profundi TaxID=2024555 RepID=A0A2A2IG12_9BACI|nr:hypothetical protein [Virgibacillus profundi]PAV30256.1 hypothetical protein CIL05_07245 [Virgibacillus profundi]PXY54428.1 hypothetical protein CIT14_07330 [Virgibacillus profundi]